MLTEYNHVVTLADSIDRFKPSLLGQVVKKEQYMIYTNSLSPKCSYPQPEATEPLLQNCIHI